MLAVAAILKRLTAAIAALDPYFNNVSLFVTANSVSGLGNKTFIDSASGLSISVGAGQPTQGSFNPFNSNYAGVFNGTTDYLTTPNNAALAFGTGDFTVEAWVYPTANSNNFPAILEAGNHQNTTGVAFLHQDGSSVTKNVPCVYSGTPSPGFIKPTNTRALTLSAWNHLVYQRSSNNLKIFVNGIGSDPISFTQNITDPSTLRTTIGFASVGIANASYYFTGNISNLRVIKGYALYTSNFTPQNRLSNTTLGVPQSAVSLLTLQNGAFVDLSTNKLAISAVGTPTLQVINTTLSSASLTAVNYTPAYDSTLHNSVYFDGSSYFSTSSNNITGDFTIEAWIYKLGSTQQTFVSLGGINFWVDTSNQLAIDNGSTPTNHYGTITLSAWNHVAASRSGSNTTLFINGSAVGSHTFTPAANTQITVGMHASSFYWNGYISNLRIVKGSAIYTSNFTPSISGLTSLLGTGYSTSLLTCQSNTIVDNSPNNLSLASVGNPTISTFNPFGVTYSDYKQGFYGGSGYFDGSSYLTSTATNISDFGANPYTFEAWIYPTVLGNQCIYDGRATSGNGLNFNVNKDANEYVYVFVNNATIGTSTQKLIQNAWNHIAVCRTATTSNGATIFVNGVGTQFTDSTTYTNPYNTIGATSYTPGAIKFTGYISNLRIIKGTAVYTANFAPPTLPVTNIPNTSLLLNFANAGIYDVTRKNNLIQYGTATASTSAKFGVGAMYFDGGSYFTSVSGNNFNLGTDDFTVEMWIYPTANAKTYPVFLEIGNHSTSSSVVFLQQNTSGNVPQIYSGAFYSPTSTPVLTLSAWNHLVYQRTSGNLRIFVNGTGSNSLAFPNSITDTRPSIGYAPLGGGTANYYYTGYIDDLRITKGVARYTSNFAVPTRELPSSNVVLPDSDPYFNNVSLLLNGNGLSGAQNNTFLDSSSNNLTITRNGTVTQGSFSPFNPYGNVYNVGVNGGSGYFDGSSSYLSSPSNTVFAFGTGDFTVDCWIYLTSSSSNQYPAILEIGNHSNNTSIGFFAQKVLNELIPAIYSGGTQFIVPANTKTLTVNAWNHIVFQRSSNNLKIFVNGIGSDNIGFTNNITTTTNVSIGYAAGYNGGAAYYIPGYISNLRIVKGTAVYTANFTPPTAPVGNISGTSLLLNFRNAGIYDLAAKNNVTTVGNAQIDSSVVKYGTGSLKFISGDYLTIPATDQYNFGTGNWTVEFWVYPLAYGGTIVGAQLFGTTNGAQTGYSINLGQDINTFRVISNASGSWIDNLSAGTGNGPSLNTWTHFAVVRNSGTLTIYKNGISVATTTGIAAYNYSGTTGVVGRFSEGLNTRDFNGYIDDLRITKGVARYTSNFTPPTAPLPIQAT